MSALTVLLAITIAPHLARPASGPLRIGFVNHYPMVKNADDRMASVGANVSIMRAPWPLIEPAEGSFDFRIIDDQLEVASRQGLRVLILIEAGPAHAAGVPWLMAKIRDAQETQVDIEGTAHKDPSIFSQVYHTHLARYARTVVRYVAQHKLAKSVYGYSNGCEWWWPMGYSYGNLAGAAFRKYLMQQYGSLSRLNEGWGSRAMSWESIAPPRLDWVGANVTNQSFMLPRSASIDVCYCTDAESHPNVVEGRSYSFRVDWTGEGIRAGGVSAEIAWLGSDSPQPIGIAMSPVVQSGAPAVVTAVAPKGATRAWLLAKSRAVGTIRFARISFRSGSEPELAPNGRLDPLKAGWHFVQWSAGEPEKVRHSWKADGAAEITYTSSLSLDTPAGYPLAVVSDWCAFRARSMATFIDRLAADIRAADPTRPVISYLTFAFANPFEWDYAQQMGILLEHWAPEARNQQVLGVQLASGEGDASSVTCALDQLRKYGKPMWTVDLLDFTRGTSLGVRGIKRLSQDAVRHGASGIQYYCWWGTPHYNYLDLGVDALRDIVTSTKAFAARSTAGRSDVALVLPRMPLYGALTTAANDWTDFMGWYKLLLHAGHVPNVYALEELLRPDLLRHRVVIVPDCAYINAAGVTALQRAARKGVRVIMSGRFAERDMTGRTLRQRSMPVPFRRFAGPIGARVLGETYRCPTPTDTPPRLVCRPGSPHWDSASTRSACAAIRDALASPTRRQSVPKRRGVVNSR